MCLYKLHVLIVQIPGWVVPVTVSHYGWASLDCLCLPQIVYVEASRAECSVSQFVWHVFLYSHFVQCLFEDGGHYVLELSL